MNSTGRLCPQCRQPLISGEMYCRRCNAYYPEPGPGTGPIFPPRPPYTDLPSQNWTGPGMAQEFSGEKISYYYASVRLKAQPPFYRRHAWKITTVVFAALIVLLLFNTLRTPKQQTQAQLASATSQPQAPNSISPTPGKITSVFTEGSTWQGTFYQHDYVGNSQSPCVLHIDKVQDAKFSGTVTESAYNNAIIAETGRIVTDVNSLGYPDKERLQIIINRHGSTGTLIMFGDPYQLNGNNMQINSHDFALVTQDGTLYGIVFDPNHDSSDLTPDGDFTLYKVTD